VSYYRVKIEEKYNGENCYIPQVCKLEISRSWVQRQRLVWYNLINNHGDTYILSLDDAQTPRHTTEERAMKVIDDYKNYQNKVQGNQLKSVTYKNID
jgi:hypothetical protein